MIAAQDALTVSQLLGRIAYFHALFVEPARQGSHTEPRCGTACCNHQPATGNRRSVDELLVGSAWVVLQEVAETLPAYDRCCPVGAGSCCATCRVVSAASAVGAGWAETEYHAYWRAVPSETLVRLCGMAAGARLGRVFRAVHATTCARQDRLIQTLSDQRAEPPSSEELPLTGELLALWAEPTSASDHPVVSWLNHCTRLDDVRREYLRRTDR